MSELRNWLDQQKTDKPILNPRIPAGTENSMSDLPDFSQFQPAKNIIERAGPEDATPMFTLAMQEGEQVATKLGAGFSAQGKVISTRYKQTPTVLLDWAARGKLDNMLIPDEYKPIKGWATSYLEKHPDINDKIIDVRRSLETPDYGFTPLEKAIFEDWSESDPGDIEEMGFFFNSLKQAGANINMLAVAPNIPVMHQVMKEEVAQTAKAQFDRRGLEFDPLKYQKQLDNAANINMVAEVASDFISIVTIAGKPVFGTADKTVLGESLLEGGEEAVQQFVVNTTVNKMLAAEAAERGIQVKKIPWQETLDDMLQGFRAGAGAGAVFGIFGSTVATIRGKYKFEGQPDLGDFNPEATVNNDTEAPGFKPIAQLTAPEQDAVVLSFAQEAEGVISDAAETVDKNLMEHLQNATLQDLRTMARALNLPIKLGTADELIPLIFNSRLEMPTYNDEVLKEVEKTAQERVAKPSAQHFIKWSAQGEFPVSQYPQMRMLLEDFAEGLGYNYDELIEERMKLSRPEGKQELLDLNEITSQFFWANNIFDVERAYNMLQIQGKPPEMVPTATVQSWKLPLVIVNEDRIMSDKIDPMNDPIIVGTSKYDTLFLIDGHHRLARAVHEQLPEIPVHIMDKEMTKMIADEDSKLVFDQSFAFHGGGKFDNFDVTYIGTGEGNQAFGWGLYFTERFGVAKQYASSYERNNKQKIRLRPTFLSPTGAEVATRAVNPRTITFVGSKNGKYQYEIIASDGKLLTIDSTYKEVEFKKRISILTNINIIKAMNSGVLDIDDVVSSLSDWKDAVYSSKNATDERKIIAYLSHARVENMAQKGFGFTPNSSIQLKGVQFTYNDIVELLTASKLSSIIDNSLQGHWINRDSISDSILDTLNMLDTAGKYQIDLVISDFITRAARDHIPGSAYNVLLRDIINGLGISHNTPHVYKVTLFPGKEAHEYTLLSWYDAVPDEIRQKLGIKLFDLKDSFDRMVSKTNFSAEFRSLLEEVWSEAFQLNDFVAIDMLQNLRDKVQQYGSDKLKDYIENRHGLKVAQTILNNVTQDYYANTTGEGLYRALTAKLGSQKAASKYLEENGIEGIIYPSESLGTGNRDLESGKNNYVIFNEKNVQIDDKKAYRPGLDFFQLSAVPDVFDSKKGVGAVPDNLDVEYKGFKVAMTPGQWLPLVPAGVSNEKSPERMVWNLTNDVKIGPPTLWVEWDEENRVMQVIDHEGRSRAKAFDTMYKGQPMEVHIIGRNFRARNVTMEMLQAPIIPQGMTANLYNDPSLSKFYKKSIAERGGEIYKEGLPTLSLLQRGRTLTSGNQVIRGRLSVIPNWGMIIDLFKTGDFNTIIHEHGHFFLSLLDDNMRDTLITELMKEYHRGLPNRGLYKAQFNQYKRLFDMFKKDPDETIGLPPRDAGLLRRMHEFFANNFQRYVERGVAPNAKLLPAFREARDTFIYYYKKVRKLPVKFQDVNPELAKMFDRVLAGDYVLPEDSHVEVSLLDDKGIAHVYTLNKSRPQLAKHKIILKYLNRAAFDVAGGQVKLMEYTKAMLGKVSPAHVAAIQNVENKNQALRYLNSVDIELAQRQQKLHDKTVKEVQDYAKKLLSMNLDPEVKSLLNNLLEYLDISRRSKINKAKMDQLAKAMNDLKEKSLVDIQEIPDEMRRVTRRQMEDLFNYRKRQLQSMSQEELDLLLDAMKDLRKYNKFRLQSAIREKAAKEAADNKRLNFQLEQNWRYKKVGIPPLKVGEDKTMRAALQHFTAEQRSTLLDMYMVGEGIEDSMMTQIADGLVHGRMKQLQIEHEYSDILRHIYEGIPEHGISHTLGSIRESDYIKVPMLRRHAGHEEVSFTIGNLMTLYGWAQNRKAFNAIMQGGSFKYQPEELLRFYGEEGLYTAISYLPERFRKIVDFIMLFYERRVMKDWMPVYRNMNFGLELEIETPYLTLTRKASGRYKSELFGIGRLDSGFKEFARRHARSMGFLNLRTDSEAPVWFEDFFQLVGRNLKDVAFYIGMVEPLEYARLHLFGNENEPGSTHQKLVRMMGGARIEEWKNTLDRIEDQSTHKDTGFVERMLHVNSKVRAAYLNLSLSVLAIQPLTVAMAEAFGISKADLLAASAKVTAQGGPRIKELMGYSPLFRERYERIPSVYIEKEGIDHMARRMWVSPTTAIKKLFDIRSYRDFRDLIRRSDDSTLMTLMYFDAMAISVMKEAGLTHWKRLGLTDEQAKFEIEKMVGTSQPINDPLFVSNFLSNPNKFHRAIFGTFQSAIDGIRRTYQMQLEKFRNRMHGQAGTKKDAAKVLYQMLYTMVLYQLALALVQTSIRRIGKDYDEDDWRESFILDWMLNAFTNVLSLDPYFGKALASGVNQYARGWEASIMEPPIASAVKTFYNDTAKLMDELKIGSDEPIYQEDYGKILLQVAKVAADMSVATGSPYYNIDRQIRKYYEAATKEK